MAAGGTARGPPGPSLVIADSILVVAEKRQTRLTGSRILSGRFLCSGRGYTATCLVFLVMMGYANGALWALGLGAGALSPQAELTLIKGQVQRDDLYYFRVLTDAWRSTRVRLAIEDCTPRTAVIASFGAEPTPSRHELLAPVSLDSNGTCGVDLITRPSYARDGVWNFAIVGGSPLHGDRYFAGPPDMLAFEAAIIAEPVLYPWLDQGLSRDGGGDSAGNSCSRVRAVPPLPVPTVTAQVPVGPAGESDAADGGWVFLPHLGKTFTTSDSGACTDYPSPWLGAFTVGANDESVAAKFEIAPVVRSKDGGENGGNSRSGGRKSKSRGRRRLAEHSNEGQDEKILTHGNAKEEAGGHVFTEASDVHDDAGGGGGGGGGGGIDNGEDASLVGEAQGQRWLAIDKEDGSKSPCVVTVCAAAARVPYWDRPADQEQEGNEAETGAEASACQSVTLGIGGESASGTLDLGTRPEAGRWYLTARVSCGNEGGDIPITRRHHRHRYLGLKDKNADSPAANGLDAGGEVADDARDGETERMQAISFQRDWAHVEWNGYGLLKAREPLPPAAADREFDPDGKAFVLNAAVEAQSCPSGRVGVHGVGLRRVIRSAAGGDGGQEAAKDEDGSVVVACLGEALPMAMARRGTTAVYEGRPHELSNLVRVEGDAAFGSARRRRLKVHYGSGGGGGGAGAGAKFEDAAMTLQEGREGGGEGGLESEDWSLEGPDLPSVWYAMEVSGREVGASMTIKLTVNSSTPITSVASTEYSAMWNMGPGLAAVDSGGEAKLPLASVEEDSLSLRVAMRVGALPVVDYGGTAREGTWVLWTADATGEANDIDPSDYYVNPDPDDQDKQDQNLWSMTYTWNLTHPPPLTGNLGAARGGGGAGTSTTTSTALFLVVQGETMAEDGGGGAGGGDDGKRLWSLSVSPEVSFSYCEKEACPEGRGECRLTNGGGNNDYITASKCHCVYGFGGEACAQRVVSYVAIIWETLLLVGSNVAVIPGVRTALRLRAFIGSAPATVLAFNGAASAVYHLCDLELTCAGGFLSYHALQALDFFFSFFSVAVLVLHLCPMPWDEPFTVCKQGSSTTTPTGADGAAAAAAPVCGEINDDEPFLRRKNGEFLGNGGIVDNDPVNWGNQDYGEMYGHLRPEPTGKARRSQSWHQRRTTISNRGGTGSAGGGSGRHPGATGTFDTGDPDGGGWAGDAKAHSPQKSNGISGGLCTNGAADRDARGNAGDHNDGGNRWDGRFAGGGRDGGGSVGSINGAGSRLASMYVCLVPLLLAAVTDSPTAGTNLALVFAMCGGLLVFSWGRLIARDMHELDDQAARERWWTSRSAAAAFDGGRDEAGDTDEDAHVAVWDDEEGGLEIRRVDDGEHEKGPLFRGGGSDGGGGGSGAGEDRCRVGFGRGVKPTAGGKDAIATTPRHSEQWRWDEEEGPLDDAEEEEGRRQRGPGRGMSDVVAQVGAASTCGKDDKSDESVAARREQGHHRRTRSASYMGAYSGRVDEPLVGGGRLREELPGSAGGGQGGLGFWSEVEHGAGTGCRARRRASSLGRLRIRAVLRSSRRVMFKRGLVDWRQAGLAGAGFVAGLTCFVAQSKFPGWYYLWHSAWHLLAMGSTVPMLKARKWGVADAGASDGSVDGTASAVHEHEIGEGGVSLAGGARLSTLDSCRAKWGVMFGTGLGGRVESRAAYEMVPK